MKNWKKIVLIIVIAAGSFGGFKAYRMYTDGPESYGDKKGIAVNAAVLMEEYSKSEAEANKKYIGKVLAVSGEIKEVTQNQEGQTVVTLKTTDPMNSVNCTMEQKDVTLKAGSAITLKGLCTGYMMDVYLKSCTVVK